GRSGGGGAGGVIVSAGVAGSGGGKAGGSAIVRREYRRERAFENHRPGAGEGGSAGAFQGYRAGSAGIVERGDEAGGAQWRQRARYFSHPRHGEHAGGRGGDRSRDRNPGPRSPGAGGKG